MKLYLKHLDPTTLEILQGSDICRLATSYKSEIWIPTQKGKRRKEIAKDFVFGRGKYIYAGFLNRLENFCAQRGYEFVVEGRKERLIHLPQPTLDVEWRPGQLETVLNAAKEQQGIIEFAPGVGKTTTAVGIASMFPKAKILFLAHEIGLVKQAYNRFIQAGYKSVSIVGDGNKNVKTDIVIATAQTYKNLDLIALSDYFNVVFIDECHFGMGANSNYEKILSTCLALVRIGLSATPAKEPEKSLMVEGLIGPKVLGKIGIQEGIELGILSKPKIKLIVVPEKKDIIKKFRKYQDIYTAGIVEYQTRNMLVAKETQMLISSGKSVLIFCERKEHIKNVAKELDKLGIKFFVVQGETDGEERMNAKVLLEKRKIDCILATKVLVAGWDCPSLGAIVNATGMESETALIQKVGRALRVSDGKDGAVVVDFLDPFPYLAQHSVSRIGTYVRNGWL